MPPKSPSTNPDKAAVSVMAPRGMCFGRVTRPPPDHEDAAEAEPGALTRALGEADEPPAGMTSCSACATLVAAAAARSVPVWIYAADLSRVTDRESALLSSGKHSAFSAMPLAYGYGTPADRQHAGQRNTKSDSSTVVVEVPDAVTVVVDAAAPCRADAPAAAPRAGKFPCPETAPRFFAAPPAPRQV